MTKSPMTRLTKAQIDKQLAFIEHYIAAENAAGGAILDPNANVSQKNIATLESEINKSFNIQYNRALMHRMLTKMFSKEDGDEYIRQLEAHEIYKHDESKLGPYCVSISSYPFLLNGTTQLGDNCDAPQHFDSFIGSFISLLFEVASQFAGAVATPEWLMMFDHFARKDFGPDYLTTHRKEIENGFASVVYRMNAPAAARNYQAVFWNIAIFDEYYFQHLFSDFVFPDNYENPVWTSVKALQEAFLTWFNEERQKKVLTFPVVTVNRLQRGDDYDRDFLEMISEQAANGNAFFTYTSPTVDSLASCCRLRNELSGDNEFSYTLGAGGVATGSISVITLNLNRLEQDPNRSLEEEIEKLHRYQLAYRALMTHYRDSGMLPVYTAGFISLEKQFSTIGLSGMAEAAEFRGIAPKNTDEYKKFVAERLKVIYDLNKKAKFKYGCMFNTEFVPKR